MRQGCLGRRGKKDLREPARSFQRTTNYLLVLLRTDNTPRRAILGSLGRRVPVNLSVLEDSPVDGVGVRRRGSLSHGPCTGVTEKTPVNMTEGEQSTRPLNPVVSLP